MPTPRVEIILRAALRQAGYPASRLEYQFHTRRRWRFDVAFVRPKVAIEIDGQRHLRHSQARKDAEKRNAAVAMGWRVLVYPASAVTTKSRLPLIVEQIARVLCEVRDPESDAYVLTGSI